MAERLRYADDVAWVSSGERVVVVRLVDPAADPLVLADSAAVIWSVVGDGSTVEEVVTSVALSYEVEVDVVRDAVEAFLRDAAERGLLRPTSRIADISSDQ